MDAGLPFSSDRFSRSHPHRIDKHTASAPRGSTTTCGVCQRPHDTKYERISIASDVSGPWEPLGTDERPPSALRARIAGWITLNVYPVL